MTEAHIWFCYSCTRFALAGRALLVLLLDGLALWFMHATLSCSWWKFDGLATRDEQFNLYSKPRTKVSCDELGCLND